MFETRPDDHSRGISVLLDCLAVLVFSMMIDSDYSADPHSSQLPLVPQFLTNDRLPFGARSCTPLRVTNDYDSRPGQSWEICR